MDQSPSPCPQCGKGQDSKLSEDDLLFSKYNNASRTHDTTPSNFHCTLEKFVEDVQKGIDGHFPSTGNRKSYTKVSALLLLWEDDNLGCIQEVEDLKTTFLNYNFEAEIWKIPEGGSSQIELVLKMAAFVEECKSSSELLIVYYAGHGEMSVVGDNMWLCRQDEINWSQIQGMTLEPKDADVLVLLDCCYAASSARARSRKRKRTELIAACGYDRKTAGVSPVSFTRNLIDVLEELLANQRYPVPVSTLYKELLVQMKNQYNCRQNRGDPLGLPSTPIHCHLGDSSETSEPIFFAPLVPLVATTIVNAGLTVESDQGSNPSPAVSSTPESSSLASSATSRIPSSSETSSGLSPLPSDSNPTVLLSISFQGEQLCDSNVFAKWIKENPAAVKHIRIEACFRSYSTLLLVSIPIEFWTSLPPDPAYSFVGFLRSSNLRTPLQQAQSAQQHEQQTTSPIYFHHWRPPTSQAGSKDPQIPLLIKSTEAAQKEVDSDLWDLKIAGAQIVPLKVSLPEVKQDLEKSKKLEYRRRTDFTHSVIGALVAKGLLLASQDSASNALSWGTIHPLMSAGAQLAVQDGSARELLNWAASSGHTTSLQILLESGADINAKDLTGHTVLHYATLQDERSAMQILLDKGVIIEAKNNAGRTALHCAASGGEDLTLRLLIIYGANVQAIAHNRGTALHYAAANGSNSTVQLLLDHGADVQAKYDSGFTPLHCAASNGKDSTVQMLLGRGAEIEARDNDGRTALYWAVLNGHVSVVQVLVDRGADSSMADSSGKTAFNIASSRGPTEIIRLLQRTSFTSLMPSYETLYDMSGMSSYETSGTPSHDTSGTTNPRKKRHLDTLRVIE